MELRLTSRALLPLSTAVRGTRTNEFDLQSRITKALLSAGDCLSSVVNMTEFFRRERNLIFHRRGTYALCTASFNAVVEAELFLQFGGHRRGVIQ